MRATFYVLTLACVLVQGIPHSARAALGGSSDSIDQDRVKMKGLTRPISTGTVQKQALQLPSGTVVTEYLTTSGQVYAVSWQGPTLPDLHQILGNYFADYQTAASHPIVRHRLVRLDSPQVVIESGGKMRAFAGRAWVPSLLPAGITGADIH